MSGPNDSRFRLRRSGAELRPLLRGDAPFVVRLFNDPAFLEYIGDRGIRDEASAVAYLEQGPWADYDSHGYGMLGVRELGEAGPLLGICGLVRRPALEHPDLGFAFLPTARGRGLATCASRMVLEDAAQRLALETVLAITSSGNVASQRVLAKLGFSLERERRIAATDPDPVCVYRVDLRDGPAGLTAARSVTFPDQVRLDVFGRTVVARLDGERWRLFWAGEGTLRPAELEVAPGLDREQLVAALEDLCHEWATPDRPRIRVLS